jgi:hypothetical protein
MKQNAILKRIKKKKKKHFKIDSTPCFTIPFRFVSVNFVSISFRFFKFLFVSMHFVSIYFVSFRFVSFRFRFAFYRDKMKMTVTWGDIASYIHGDGLTIGVLLLIICLAWVNLSFING